MRVYMILRGIMIFFFVSVVCIYVDTRLKVRKYLPLKASGNTQNQISWVLLNLKNLEMLYKNKDLESLTLKLEKSLQYNIALEDELIEVITNIIKPFVVNNKTIKMELDKIKHLL